MAQPTLSSPSDGATGVSIQPTFTWSGHSTTEKLQVATDNGFSSIVVDKSLTNNEETYTLSESEKLNNNTTYYWRVSTDNGTTWSSVNSFTTIASISVTLSWPTNGATVYTTSTYFSWYAYLYGTNLKFKVQVTSTTSGGSPVWTSPDFEGTTTSYYYVFTLLQGKTYYWRVIVMNTSNEILSYSSNVQFTTSGGAETPTPSYPTGGMTVYYNPPTFYWYINSIGTDVTYDLQVDDDNAFGSPAVNATNISALYYTPSSALSSGTTYYWRVRSVYKRGTANEVVGSWSSTASFATNSTSTVTTPQLSYPTGGVTVYTTSPYLYWYLNGSSSGISFDVYYKESGAGSFTHANGSAITNLYYQLTGLTAGKTYEWYVVATDGSTTKTSAHETFVVYQATSGSPVASYPTGGATVYTLTPTLYWYLNGSSTGLTKYTVRWKAGSNSSDWSTDYDGTADVTNLNTTYYTFTSNLTYGQTYYWAVAAYNGSSYTSWSEGSFVVYSSTLTAPTPSYPIGGVTVYSTSVTLSWYLNGSYAAVQSYEVHYSNDGFTSNDVTISPNPTTTSTTITGLTAGATYSWKVKANYAGGVSSAFSSVATFTVDAGAAPVQPLPGSPNNVAVDTDSPVISWVLPTKSSSQLTYELELSDNPSFNNATTIRGLTNPFDLVSGLSNGRYYWRTRSVTADGKYSDYSQVAHFDVNSATAVGDNEIVPTEFALSQNYPNPFNPTTRISYQLAKDSYVTLKVYDLLGREVATLVNKNMKAGKYSVDFNASNLATGIYFYKLTAGDFNAVRKMILLK
jgi:hypothetical protein